MSAMSQPVTAVPNNNGYPGYNYGGGGGGAVSGGAVPTPFTQSVLPNGHLPNNNYAPQATAAATDQAQYYWGQ